MGAPGVPLGALSARLGCSSGGLRATWRGWWLRSVEAWCFSPSFWHYSFFLRKSKVLALQFWPPRWATGPIRGSSLARSLRKACANLAPKMLHRFKFGGGDLSDGILGATMSPIGGVIAPICGNILVERDPPGCSSRPHRDTFGSFLLPLGVLWTPFGAVCGDGGCAEGPQSE